MTNAVDTALNPGLEHLHDLQLCLIYSVRKQMLPHVFESSRYKSRFKRDYNYHTCEVLEEESVTYKDYA